MLPDILSLRCCCCYLRISNRTKSFPVIISVTLFGQIWNWNLYFCLETMREPLNYPSTILDTSFLMFGGQSKASSFPSHRPLVTTRHCRWSWPKSLDQESLIINYWTSQRQVCKPALFCLSIILGCCYQPEHDDARCPLAPSSTTTTNHNRLLRRWCSKPRGKTGGFSWIDFHPHKSAFMCFSLFLSTCSLNWHPV